MEQGLENGDVDAQLDRWRAADGGPEERGTTNPSFAWARGTLQAGTEGRSGR